LALPLCRLVLRNIFHQTFQPAVHATMIQIEPKAPDSRGFAAALMLPRVESLEHLIVAREQRLAEDLGVPAIKRRFDRPRCDCDAGMTRLDDRILAIIALLRGANS